jgi:phosphopantetheinyl transferase (holo-ACP synthase)
MFLYGNAKKALDKLPGAKVQVSLTHEHDYALAVVIIEGLSSESSAGAELL